MTLSYVFNPFTSNLDLIDSGGTYWQDPVASFSNLPTTDPDGTGRIVRDEDAVYTYDAGSNTWIFAGKIKTTSIGSSPNNNGYSVAADNTLTLQPADATHPGVIANASQTIPGSKTFPSLLNADGGIDRSSAGTLAIGTSANATTINIGNTGATVNIQGTVITETSTTLNVTNPVFTINKGGAAGSASNSGMQVEENSSITGYVETSANRNSWILKAPNTAGIATITPGSSGITLDQSSHNPVTLAAVGSTPNANGASLSTQVLNLQPADGSNPGVLTAGSQTIGGTKTFSSNPVMSGLTASQAVVTDASKNLTSLAYSATGGTSNIVSRDANGNSFANNFTSGATNTVSSGTTTTLTASSTRLQVLTGSTTQTYKLPDATTLSAGTTYRFNNNSTGTLTVVDNGSNTITTVVSGASSDVSLTVGVTSNGVWDPHFILPSNSTYGTAGLTITGTLNVTSTTTLNTSLSGPLRASSGVVSTGNTSLTSEVTGTLPIGNGGTGLSATPTDGQLLIGKTSTNSYVQSTLTAGTGISVSNGSGSITITNSKANTTDIADTSFSALNNTANQNITSFSFSTSTVRAFRAFVSVSIVATSSLFEAFEIMGIYNGTSWQLSQNSVGDNSLITLHITNAGQMQIDTGSYSGFSSATVHFRAQTLIQ